MVCGNMKFISSVDQDFLQVSKANKWDILFNFLTQEIISYFQAFMYSVYYMYIKQ